MTEWNEETRKRLERHSTKTINVVEGKDIDASLREIARLEKRVDDLLAYNTAEVERRRKAEQRIKELEEVAGD